MSIDEYKEERDEIIIKLYELKLYRKFKDTTEFQEFIRHGEEFEENMTDEHIKELIKE